MIDGDRERVHPVGPAVAQRVVAVLERLEAADAGGDRRADARRLGGDVEARVRLGLPRRREHEMGEPVHAPRRLAVDPLLRIEVLHLAGEVDRSSRWSRSA